MINVVRLQFLAAVVVFVFATDLQAQIPVTFVPTGATWRYSDNGSDQGTNWVARIFDDSGWKSGPAELGYGDPFEPGTTVVEDNPTPGYTDPVSDRFITTYFRHSFVLTNAQDISNLHVGLLRDDGGVVYLNGQEVFRSNVGGAPGTPAGYQTPALAPIPQQDETRYFTNSVDPAILVNGTNVLAVEIHQSGPTSTDMSFNVGLYGTVPGTGNSGPTVSLTAPAVGAFSLSRRRSIWPRPPAIRMALSPT
jgi:hypothetical protein